VHFYDIITAENVGAGIPLKHRHFLEDKIEKMQFLGNYASTEVKLYMKR
jgi:hypothetical protein